MPQLFPEEVVDVLERHCRKALAGEAVVFDPDARHGVAGEPGAPVKKEEYLTTLIHAPCVWFAGGDDPESGGGGIPASPAGDDEGLPSVGACPDEQAQTRIEASTAQRIANGCASPAGIATYSGMRNTERPTRSFCPARRRPGPIWERPRTFTRGKSDDGDKRRARPAEGRLQTATQEDGTFAEALRGAERSAQVRPTPICHVDALLLRKPRRSRVARRPQASDRAGEAGVAPAVWKGALIRFRPGAQPCSRSWRSACPNRWPGGTTGPASG